jgi:hypothetical protein
MSTDISPTGAPPLLSHNYSQVKISWGKKFYLKLCFNKEIPILTAALKNLWGGTTHVRTEREREREREREIETVCVCVCSVFSDITAYSQIKADILEEHIAYIFIAENETSMKQAANRS